MRESQPTARFWVRWNETYTRLTLRPGQSIQLHEYHDTDEGWSSTSERYAYAIDDDDNPSVFSEWTTDGRDCDGRLTQYGEAFCPVADLMAREPYHNGTPDKEVDERVRFPEWQGINHSQRDQFAEMAGY